MGSPLGVRYHAGREPMVLMTLEAYEQITDGSRPKPVRKSTPVAPTPEPMTEPMGEPEPVSIPVMTVEEVQIDVMSPQEKAEISEISLEDRFFIEAE